MGQVVNLPHHRRGPRIDEQRRRDDDDPAVVNGLFAFCYALGVVVLVLYAFGVLA